MQDTDSAGRRLPQYSDKNFVVGAVIRILLVVCPRLNAYDAHATV
jgi:hypothetical protein